MGTCSVPRFFLFSRIHSFTYSPPIKYFFSCYSMPGNVLPAGEVMMNSNKECAGQGTPTINMCTDKEALSFQMTSAVKKSKAGSEARDGQG